MAQTIDNQATGDDYTAATTIEEVFLGSGGYGSISGADVFCQMQYGHLGATFWADEVHVPVGTIQFPDKITGIRFRSYLSGVPATVTAAVFEGPEPQLVIGAGGQSEVTVSGIPAYNVQTFGAKGTGLGDDTAAIQAAISAAEANTSGGLVYIPPGLYPVSAPLVVQQSNVAIWGAGGGSGSVPSGLSVIRATSSFSGSAMLIVQSASPSTTSLANIYLRDFELDGFGAGSPFTNCHGIVLGAFRSRLQNVNVWRVQKDGIVLDGGGSTVFPLGAWDNLLVNCNVGSVGANGLHFQNDSSDNTVEACIVGPCGGNSVQIDSGNPGVRVLDCYLQTATGYHIYAAECGQLEVVGCRLRESAGGIAVAPTANNGPGLGFVIEGNTFKNCSEGTDNTTDGIYVAPSGSGTVVGGVIGHNSFSSSDSKRMRYAVNIANSAASGIVVANQSYSFQSPGTACYGTAAINNAGTNTRVEKITLAQNAVQASHTGDLLETTLATITVPGGLIGANGRVRVNVVFSRNSGGSASLSVRARFSGASGTAYLNLSLTTAQVVDYLQTEIANRNSQASQVGAAAVGLGTGAALLTSSVDTSADTTLVLTGQLTNAADSVSLESYNIEVMPG